MVKETKLDVWDRITMKRGIFFKCVAHLLKIYLPMAQKCGEDSSL